jgi:2-polyprenyl-3-methyl-5-hydroxy-6-metoxy-1,4-benzoquinol methylase
MSGTHFIAKHLANANILTRGYTPERVTRAVWEKQFSAGAWNRLEGTTEVGHYSVIVGYCEMLFAKRILDVGCGQGVLAQRVKRLPYEHYVGIDVSSAAVNDAKARQIDTRNQFSVAPAETFRPEGTFDLIVFNECLYYFDHPVELLESYMRFLSASGHVLVSMYDCVRTRALWRLMDKTLSVVDGGKFAHLSGPAWTVKILRA